MSSSEYIIIMTNCRDDREADYITKALFDAKLAAVIQTNKVHSHYYHNDTFIHDSEIRLMIKTKATLFEDCKKLIKQRHSYNLPEILAIPVVDGSRDFFKFMDYAVGD